MTREEKMGENEDQYLMVHTRRKYKKKEKKHNFHHNNKKENKQNKTKIDPSNVRCYTCDEKGHFARDYPIRKKRHMLILPKTMNQKRKDLEERRMI